MGNKPFGRCLSAAMLAVGVVVDEMHCLARLHGYTVQRVLHMCLLPEADDADHHGSRTRRMRLNAWVRVRVAEGARPGLVDVNKRVLGGLNSIMGCDHDT